MLTPEQRAKIRQKEAEQPDALRREPLADYREGWFHVTLNVHDRLPILGRLSGRIDAEAGTPDAPHIVLTEAGKAVEASWNNNPSHYPGIENVAFQIMPEHIHGLIHLKPGNRDHLGRIIQGFMIGCTHGYWDVLGIDWRSMTYEKGVRTPQYNDRDHTHSKRGPGLFVRGYNDVEAVTPEQVQIKIRYIDENPRRRMIKRECHDCFAVIRDQKSANWHAERVRRALATDRFFGNNRQQYDEAWAHVQAQLQTAAPSATPGILATDLRLAYVGNRELLGRRKVSLICHRSEAAAFERQCQAVLQAARQGAVVVSAFISPREQKVLELLLQEQLPVVRIMDNGFSEQYSPTGLSFYACAEGRLMQFSCWQYHYRKQEETITREFCLVMNELARVISQCDDGWWKEDRE